MKKKGSNPKKNEHSQKKRIPLLYEIFKEFRFLTAQHLFSIKMTDKDIRDKLLARDITDETDQLAIIRICLSHDENLKIEFGNIGVGYFDKTSTYYANNNYRPKEVDLNFFKDLFCALFQYKKDISRNRFLWHLIKKIDYELKCDRFKRLEQIRILKKFIDRKPEYTVNQAIVKESLFKRFKNSKWYLYFYGYTKVGHSLDPNYWKLVRLTLEFDKVLSGGELGIIIDNNEDEDHRNYIGKTNFRNSTDKVLVMNFRTEERERDLNIKFYVGNLGEDIFEGQYLNYEAQHGRIISGSLLMVNCKENPVDIHPAVFPIAIDGSNKAQYPDMQEIIEYFQGHRSAFRETLGT